jgi:hypothetical protein
MTDPLALISKAERALSEATDITELMDLRSMAKAAEAAAVALGLADIAQHAKVFQLRAERKAGAWLSVNIHHDGGRPPEKPSQGETVIRLSDLDIDRNASARWQAIAAIPEAKFTGYLDEHLARGWEVTAGGLRSYARNLNGHAPETRRPAGLYLVPPPGVCALAGYKVPCSGRMTGQHIVSKQMARGNEEVRDILRACPPELIARCCEYHNISKYADAPEARKILLLQKVHEFGWSHMRDFINGLPWKVPMHSLTLEAMLE